MSVVIPVCNAEKYIRECLDATINQTYKNIEIIVVDNKSHDKTAAICREYANKDNRIRLLNNSVQSASATRNMGIDDAKGDFIVFFDADDYPETDIIERYFEAALEWSNKELAFIVCGMFFENKINKYVNGSKSVLEEGHGYIEGEKYLLARSSVATLSWLKLFNFVTNKFYDLNFIKANGIRFDPNVNIGEDLKFNLDILDVNKGSIGMVNKALYHYVKRSENSLSLTYHDTDIEDTKKIYRKLVEWEENHKGATEENILVVKAMYLTDWISRLTTLYLQFHHKGCKASMKRKLRKELQSKEFKLLLDEVHKAGKISTLRYICLRTGYYEIFYCFRKIYQIMKG